MKRPSFQFYPGDWLNDAALRACSIGARGLWIDMLCLMHQGSSYGYLKVNHTPILPANLARMIGATLPDVEGWIGELEAFGVFSRDEEGCIMSRRMIRDEKIRESRASGGKLGGNPALMNGTKVNHKVNHKVNLKPTPSSSSSSSLKDIDKAAPSRSTRSPKTSPPEDFCVSAENQSSPEAEILDYLNVKAGRDYRPVKANIALIGARLREGASVEDCRKVIDGKVAEWKGDAKMSKYLRPETLFGATKFAGYVGERAAQPKIRAVAL